MQASLRERSAPTMSTVPRKCRRVAARTGVSGLDSRSLERFQHLVNQSVFDGFLGGQNLVAFDIVADFFGRFAGRFRKHRLEEFAHTQDLVGLDFPVGDLPAGAFGVGLVDKDASVCLLYTSPSPRDRTRSRMP